MVWNKTSEEKLASILEDIRADFTQRYVDIAENQQVSEWLVSEIARKFLSPEERAKRYSEINRAAKLKVNPMTGRTRTRHHRAKDVIICSGYLTEWAPEWWTGSTPKGNRCHVHQRVWCEANGKTCVEEGKVIHHLDGDKFNNTPDNLICLTRREHAQIHCVENLLAKRNDYPKGVESSALEAQSSLLSGG